MVRSPIIVLYLLACVVSVTAVRYGDYSVAYMPQYSDHLQDNDRAPERDDYSYRSPDASGRLDYKYEEEPHGKSEGLPLNDVADHRIWDKRIKRIRQPSVLRSERNYDLDKYTSDETEPIFKTKRRFVMNKSKFRKRKYGKQNESQRYLMYSPLDQNDDIDNIEKNSDYIDKEHVEMPGNVDTEEISHFPYVSTTQRKPKRKPRDRAMIPSGWRGDIQNTKIIQEDIGVISNTENFDTQVPRRFDGITRQEGANRKNKNSYDYNEYYDMKRVQYIKTRVPTLLRQPTVRTTEAKRISNSGHWLNRRADSSTDLSVSQSIVVEATSSVRSSTRTSTVITAIAKTTLEIKLTTENSTEISLAEKSRLSILKKAQRKESSRNLSSSTKPPVLMQVTRKMQTLVMVEPRAPEIAMRAREVFEDSPERLRRARRLMRRKMVANARNIHELTDNWNEMICDYIDVSLLDVDAACSAQITRYITVFLLLSLFIFN